MDTNYSWLYCHMNMRLYAFTLYFLHYFKTKLRFQAIHQQPILMSHTIITHNNTPMEKLTLKNVFPVKI